VLNILAENFEVSDEVVLRTQDRLGFGDWPQQVWHVLSL
jgi:hypothetical protein